MWRWQEGLAEVKATFRSALDRMNEFPDYKFTSGCSLYYMWIEQSDKEMFEEIVKRVQEGRWGIVGGWYIQPDCNAPADESYARHALISQRYFQEKFGVIAKTGYNVDSFGHNGALPKILQNSGMTNYVFMRPMPHEKELPQNLFWWKSMDDSAVLTYRIPYFYNIDNTRFEVFEQVRNLDGDHDEMAFFGVGNHGGGPTIALLDRMQRQLDEDYIYDIPDDYFDTVRKLELPEVKDDLQFHAKGCYSACTSIKAGNRYAENAVLTTEKFSVLSERLIGTKYPGAELKRAWKNILMNQFHDVLGGCSIKEAYTDAAYIHGEAMSIAGRCTNFVLQQISWNIDTMDGKQLKTYKPDGYPTAVWKCEEHIGTPVVVFNSLAHSVNTAVTIREVPLYMTDDTGAVISIQKVRDSKTNGDEKYGTAFSVSVPPLGYRTYRMYFEGSPVDEKNPLICTENSMENEYLRIRFDKNSGEPDSIFDKKEGKELLAGRAKTKFADETHCDTWAHGIREFKDIVGVFEEGTVKLIENGPVRAVIRSEMHLFQTTIIRDYMLEAGSSIIKVRAKIDFHEKHKMLKFSLPLNAAAPKAYCRIPYGFIERPTDGTEQPCGSWIALKSKDTGIAVANDSKYSFDADGSTLSLTIMRGAIYNDHFGHRDEFCEYMDQGIHWFEYSIFPFVSFTDCERKAQELNNKPETVMETFHKGSLPVKFSGLEVSAENVIVTAVKKYEDGDGIVLRCYETEDKETDVTIRIFDTAFETHLTHSEVKTFLIRNGAVREVDFMEWEK